MNCRLLSIVVCILAYCRNAHESATTWPVADTEVVAKEKFFQRYPVAPVLLSVSCLLGNASTSTLLLFFCESCGRRCDVISPCQRRKEGTKNPRTCRRETLSPITCGDWSPTLLTRKPKPAIPTRCSPVFGWIFKRAERPCDRSHGDVVTVVAALVASRDGAQTSEFHAHIDRLKSCRDEHS